MIAAAALGVQLGEQAGASLLNRITGASTNAARSTREAWTLQMAQQGSPTAAAIVKAAPANVSNNEASGWLAELASIPSDVMAAAIAEYGAGGWWPEGLPDFYTDTNGTTHQQILAEVNAASKSKNPAYAPPAAIPTGSTSTNGAVTGTGTGVQKLPTVFSNAPAPKSYTMYIVGALVVVGLIVVVVIARRRR